VYNYFKLLNLFNNSCKNNGIKYTNLCTNIYRETNLQGLKKNVEQIRKGLTEMLHILLTLFSDDPCIDCH